MMIRFTTVAYWFCFIAVIVQLGLLLVAPNVIVVCGLIICLISLFLARDAKKQVDAILGRD